MRVLNITGVPGSIHADEYPNGTLQLKPPFAITVMVHLDPGVELDTSTENALQASVQKALEDGEYTAVIVTGRDGDDDTMDWRA